MQVNQLGEWKFIKCWWLRTDEIGDSKYDSIGFLYFTDGPYAGHAAPRFFGKFNPLLETWYALNIQLIGSVEECQQKIDEFLEAFYYGRKDE